MRHNVITEIIASDPGQLIRDGVLTLPGNKLGMFLGVDAGRGGAVVRLDEKRVTRLVAGRWALLISHLCEKGLGRNTRARVFQTTELRE